MAQAASDVVVDELRKGIHKAARANVDVALVKAAQELLKEAEKRDALAERVSRLMHLPELTLDIEKTVGIWGEALEAGVAKEPALKLQETMQRAAEIQARHDAAAKQLQMWVEMDPLKVHSALLMRAKENAATAHAAEEKLFQAEEVLKNVEMAQAQCDHATVKLLLAAAATSAGPVKDAVTAARQARVDERYIQIAEERHKVTNPASTNAPAKLPAKSPWKRAAKASKASQASEEKPRRGSMVEMLLGTAEAAYAEKQLAEYAAAANEASHIVEGGKTGLQRAHVRASDSIKAVFEARTSVHETGVAASRSQEAKEAAVEIGCDKVIHEVSYDTPLIEVDVAMFEAEIAQIAGIPSENIFVDVRIDGDGTAPMITSGGGGGRRGGGGGCCDGGKAPEDMDVEAPVQLANKIVRMHTAFFIPRNGSDSGQIKSLLHKLTHMDHPAVKLSTTKPKAMAEETSAVMLQSFLDVRAKYLETRKTYDVQFSSHMQDRDQDVVTAAEEMLLQLAATVRRYLEEAEGAGRTKEVQLRTDAQLKKQAADGAKQKLAETRKAAESAELKIVEETLKLESAIIGGDPGDLRSIPTPRQVGQSSVWSLPLLPDT